MSHHKGHKMLSLKYVKILVIFQCSNPASYLTLFVNCTPVFMTRGLSGCIGIQGCLSTTKALEDKVDHVSETNSSKYHNNIW